MNDSMNKAVSLLNSSIVGIRTGTITAGVIDTVKYQQTPIKYLASTGKVHDVINIEPYDPSSVNGISKALIDSGFNAYVYSKTCVRVNCPPPSGDEKKRIIAHLDKLAEEARISIRNIRKKCRQSLTKEQLKTADDEIQKMTDMYISEVNFIIQGKKDKI